LAYTDQISEGMRPPGRPVRSWENTIKWIVNKYDVKVWTGFSLLSIGPSGRFLWTQ